MSLPGAIPKNAGHNKTLEAEIAKAFLLAEKTCSSPSVLGFATQLPGVSITFHELIIILGVVAVSFNCLGSVYLVSGHIYHWVNPHEQKQILRIIMLIPIMSLTAFFSIYFYHTEGYLHPVSTYYEGFAITALFLLYVQYLCPNPNERAQYFTNLERRWWNGKVMHARGSLNWYRLIYVCVLQITITRILTTIALEVLWGITCPLSKVREQVDIAIQVIQGLSTTIAVNAVIFFEHRMHPELQRNYGLLKLVSFKSVVILEATQAILFSVLASKGVYFPKPPYHVSWFDFDVGIPQFILLWELVAMTIAFLWGYTSLPYAEVIQAGNTPLVPTWKAFLSVFDFRDIIAANKYMFTAYTKSTYLEGPIKHNSDDTSAQYYKVDN